jgi:hypothetical protein
VVEFLLICDIILLLLRLQKSLNVAAVVIDAAALKFDVQTSAGAFKWSICFIEGLLSSYRKYEKTLR